VFKLCTFDKERLCKFDVHMRMGWVVAYLILAGVMGMIAFVLVVSYKLTGWRSTAIGLEWRNSSEAEFT